RARRQTAETSRLPASLRDGRAQGAPVPTARRPPTREAAGRAPGSAPISRVHLHRSQAMARRTRYDECRLQTRFPRVIAGTNIRGRVALANLCLCQTMLEEA